MAAVVTNVDALRQAALALPGRERAGLAADLLASLDPTPTDDPDVVEALWAEELQRRAQKIVDGEGICETWESLRERLAQRLVT